MNTFPRTALAVGLFGLVLAGVVPGTHALTSPSATLTHFLEATDRPLTSYVAVRHMEAHNPRYGKHAWMDVRTSLDDAHGFQFEVVRQGGSAYVREKVMTKVLEREAQAWQTGEADAALISPANYEFGEERPGSDGFLVVPMMPRRKNELLLHGTLHFEPGTGDLMRIEGRTAKPPSFWTRRVDIVRRYARIAGVRVPVATESTASVLMAGRSTFLLRYDYEMVNGQAVAGPVVAAPLN